MSHLDLPLLIEVEQLNDLNHQHIRWVDLSRANVYRQLHLPHAIAVSPKDLVRTDGETTGLLPEQAGLHKLIEQLQLSPQHHVIAYDDEGGGWASRLLWTLHCMGFHQTSLLNGGLHACLAHGLEMTSQVILPEAVEERFQLDTTSSTQYRIQFDELLSQVTQQNVQLWDCRSREEFIGEKRTARRAGHIPNAIHYDWLNLFNPQQQFKLYPLEQIKANLQQQGFDLNRPVVVYCQSHHRSSLAYVVARLLNWQVRAYDGAWSEWGNHSQSLIETGT